MTMRIQICGREEASLIRELSIRTFCDTFGRQNDPGDMKDYLATAFSLETIVDQLENPDSFFYLLWDQDQPAGYLKLNQGPAQTELQDPAGLEIERIYLSDRYQGQGLGQKLMDFALAQAERRGKEYVWLGVWEKNRPALAFYQRNGFRKIGEHAFMVGEDQQTDFMMRRDLPSA